MQSTDLDDLLFDFLGRLLLGLLHEHLQCLPVVLVDDGVPQVELLNLLSIKNVVGDDDTVIIIIINISTAK